MTASVRKAEQGRRARIRLYTTAGSSSAGYLPPARWGEGLEVMSVSVEEAAPRVAAGQFDTIVVDPSRTGLSPEALSAVVRIQASRVVYISCGSATLARDAALLVGGGYQLGAVEAFDMFPTTAHVETLAVFDRTITA